MSLKTAVAETAQEENAYDIILLVEEAVAPTDIKLHRGHMTNGIPSWAVPSNVMWNGELRKWHHFVPSWRGSDEREEETTDYPDHIPSYPCQVEDIIETQEYLQILKHAEIDVMELSRDLQRK